MPGGRQHVEVERPAHLPLLVFDRVSIQAVDREAVERYHIPGIVLMENAARGLCAHALRLSEPGSAVLICCGSGNNGGDGYALARHLHNAGVRAILAPLGEPRIGSDAAANDAICRAMGLRRIERSERSGVQPDLVVDAIFGTGLDRPVCGEAADWIAWMNKQSIPRLAVDVPSGLDCNSGQVLGGAVRADHTVTFVGCKEGFLAPSAAPYVGTLSIVDIGAPIELYLQHGRPLDSRSGASGETDLQEGSH